ncbi:MAG TPA: thioesterase family protein, partial [Gammaproteobacteria bacterium]|nr:thioesterase family protein [Gammaproteobacteria bacterium]
MFGRRRGVQTSRERGDHLTKSTDISPQALLDATRVFEERIPFNRVLGLRIERLGESDVVVRFDMRDELIGNFTRGNLHGGVISSVLDVVGGLVAFIALLKREGVQSLEDEADKFSRLGTIDLRVD